MSSESRAELIGPARWDGQALLAWFRTFARADAAALGTLDPATKDDITVGTVAGEQVAFAAYSVRTGSGTRYIAYGVLQNAPAGVPIFVVRSTFGDALTFARTFRSSVQALLPYVIGPTASMRALQPLAAAGAPVTTLRDLSNATLRAADAVPAQGAAAAGDSAVRGAVDVGIKDAIALLDSVMAAAPPSSATTTSPSSSRTPSRTATQRTGPSSPMPLPALLTKVVFYQFGDLQYHPVALFRDGTSYDVSEEPLERVDPIAARRARASDWGRWRSVGTRIFLSDAAGGQENDYGLDDGEMHTAFGASPGTTLDATYKAVSGTSFGETSTLLTSRIQFMPNGRFASGRDFAAVGSGEQSGVSMAGGSSSGSAGSYRISGHRIVLTYDGGTTAEYFFAFGSGGRPAVIDREMIFIGRIAYVK